MKKQGAVAHTIPQEQHAPDTDRPQFVPEERDFGELFGPLLL